MQVDFIVVIAGLAGGFVAAILFRWVSARVARVDFWGEAMKLAHSLVVADGADFFKQYGELLKLLTRYLRRQVLTLALPTVAIAAMALLILPRSAECSNADDAGAGEPAARDVRGIASLAICGDSEVFKTVVRASPRILASSPDGQPSSLLGLGRSDLAFFFSLCIGSAASMALWRRKR